MIFDKFKKRDKKNQQNQLIKQRWYNNATIYHLYLLSFYDSNDDGYGDFGGLIKKLDYLKGGEQSLDVDAVWISPFQKSPMKDWGYDISDYYQIDPIFGTMEDFKKFIQESKKRNLKIIMDFVANHTSTKHPWFQEPKSSINNPKRDWYIWKDPQKDGSPPNNWLSVFGGSAWTFDSKTGQYYLHSFLSDQPDLNWRNAEVIEEMKKVLEFWVDLGVDGFRIDAMYYLLKDPDFKDDPLNPNYQVGKDDPYNKLLHVNSQGNKDLFNTVGFLCDFLSKYEDKLIVSEAYLNVSDMVDSYRACDAGSHIPFNFNLIGIPWDAIEYKKFVDEFEASLSKNDLPNYVLGNHDRSRVVARLGEKRARIAALLTFTLRGISFIYQGEEIGMDDGEISKEEIKDPFEIKVPGMNLGRDKERTPLHWNQEENAGFSKVKPWLPVSDKYLKNNIESQLKTKDSFINLYKFLIKYKKDNKVLKFGNYVPIEIKNPHLFCFIREHESKQILVVINFSDQMQYLDFDKKTSAKLIANSFFDTDPKNIALNGFEVRGDEAVIFEL